jgi:hypothetical protein
MRIAAFFLIGVCLFTARAESMYKTAFDDDGMVTVNGTRTFIIGTYHTGNKYSAPSPTAELFKEQAEAGFNLARGAGDTADLAQAAGLMTWTSVGTLDLDNREASEKTLRGKVRMAASHPSVAILESVDEPAWTWMKAEARIPADPFVAAYPVIKEEAPNLLLYMNHAPTNLVSTMQAYNDGTDIVAMDIYPVNPGGLKHQYALFEDGHQGDLNNQTISQVGEYADKMRRVTGPNRPLFMVLQGFAWEMLVDETQRREEKVLYPTRGQQRFMAFQSIIHGANGLMYWGTAYTLQPSQAWSDLKATVREVADLGPVLAERTVDVPIEATYHETGHSVDDGVQWIVKDHGEARYLLTCNADRYACRATLSGLGEWSQAVALNEDRSIPVENGAFTDGWARFDVHLYRLER